jgi:hypothetical protein
MRTSLLLGSVFLAGLLGVARAGELGVKLTVQEPSGVARKGAKYFAVRAFDDSSNRGAMSNVSGE